MVVVFVDEADLVADAVEQRRPAPVSRLNAKICLSFRYRNHLQSGELPIVRESPLSISVRSPVSVLTR